MSSGLFGSNEPDPVMRAELARIRVAAELQAAILALEFYNRQGDRDSENGTADVSYRAAQKMKPIVGKLAAELARMNQ